MDSKYTRKLVLYKTDNINLQNAFIEELKEIGYIYDGIGEFDVLYTLGRQTYGFCEKNSNDYKSADVFFDLETQWKNALEYAQSAYQNDFKIGEWVINDMGVLINIQEETKSGYKGYGFSISGWTDNGHWDTIKQTNLRKASSKEILKALKAEAKHREFIPGARFRKPSTYVLGNVTGEIRREAIQYIRSADMLEMGGNCIYKAGEWAEMIDKEFFNLKVIYPRKNSNLIKIGCHYFQKDYLDQIVNDLKLLLNATGEDENVMTITDLYRQLKDTVKNDTR